MRRILQQVKNHNRIYRRNIVIPPVASIYNAFGAINDVVGKGGNIMEAVQPKDAQRELRATCALVTAHQELLLSKGLLRFQESAICSIFVNKALQLTETDFEMVPDEETGWLQGAYQAMSTTAKQSSQVLDTTLRASTGFETKFMKIASNKSGLQFILDVLGTHQQVQNHQLLQELLVSSASARNLLKTTINVTPAKRRKLNSNDAPTLDIQWETDWPLDRLGSFELNLESRTSGNFKIATEIPNDVRQFEWIPPLKDEKFNLLKNSVVSSSAGFRIKVLPITKGAVVEEPNGIQYATSNNFDLGVTFERRF